MVDLGLDIYNRFLTVNCKVYYLASESFHIDLHCLRFLIEIRFSMTSLKVDKSNYGFLLNIIVRKGSV